MTYLQTYTIQSQVYISIFLDKYTYKNIILYIVKSSLRFMFFKKKKKKSQVHELIYKYIIMFELDLFNNCA